MLGVYTVSTYFTTQKQYWWDANSETIHGQLLHLLLKKAISFSAAWPAIKIMEIVLVFALWKGLSDLSSSEVCYP